MNKIITLIVLGICLVGLVGAQASYCCERTDSGAWCQNAEEASCDDAYRSVPTSCEATSYCRLGCCYDSQEGTCMENTPERICNDNGGVWENDAQCDIPQCELGCCLIGDQASFVTQTRCKRLASLYGLEIDFRTNIGNEIQCIASATSDVKGACVFEREFEKTCLFVSKRECQEINDASFYADTLCSSESLGANCGPTEQTTCVEGRDEVYLVDSCGNLANIYDAGLIDSKEYWSKIYEKSESCNPASSNADSATCGNCNYYLGSTCKAFKRGEDTTRPNYGDNICRDLSCEFEGSTYEHGETWCADAPGASRITTNANGDIRISGVDLPGSRHFRLVCYNNEVSVEACADFRQEVCIESEVNEFQAAACIVNRWQDGVNENYDVAPGFNFWDLDGEAQQICSAGNAECVEKYEEDFGEDKECVGGCDCVDKVGGSDDGWQSEMMGQCVNLGDCGTSKNYLGY